MMQFNRAFTACPRSAMRIGYAAGRVALMVGLVFPVMAQSGGSIVDIDAPANGQTYSGLYIFGGWALDNSNHIRNVILTVDGAVYSTAPYGNSRQDVCDVLPDYLDCPNVGWSFAFDTSQLVNGQHTLTVTVVTSDNRQTAQSTTFFTNNSNSSMVTIDTPVAQQTYSGWQGFGGWAVDGTMAISSVAISIDGSPYGSAVYGGSGGYRQDVCNALGNLPGCPYVGWNLGVDTSQLANGMHVITAAALTEDGRLTIANSVFYTSNTTSTLDTDWPSAAYPIEGLQGFGGWAVDGTSSIVGVSAAVDGIPFPASYGGNRQDVCDALGNYQGCPNVGWNVGLDTSQLPDGLHTLTVTTQTADSRLTQMSVSFYTDNAPVSSSYSASVGSGYGYPGCLSADAMADSFADTHEETDNDPQGLLHIKYAFTDGSGNVTTPDSTTFLAANAAIQQWNNFSVYTGVEFDPLAPGDSSYSPGVLHISPGNDVQSGGCAKYDPLGFVFYNTVAHDSTGFRTELAHEIGHFLGLGNAAIGGDAQSYPATIMNQGSPGSCADPDVPTTNVQLADAGLVLTCRQVEWNYQVKLGHRISYGSTYSGPSFDSTSSPTPVGQVWTCSYTYTTTYFYVDGVLDSSEDDVSGFYCLYE